MIQVNLKKQLNMKFYGKKIYSDECCAHTVFHHFDGEYFYFGLWSKEKAKCGVVKYDLNGKNIWGKMVNLTEVSGNADVQYIQSISKIDNKLYILTSKNLDENFRYYNHNLIILDALSGAYYGLYPLVQDHALARNFKADVWENIVYVALVTYDIGLNIYCFDKSSSSPVPIERSFTNIMPVSEGSKFISEGKMYFRGGMDGSVKQLIVLDCLAVADNSKTNEQCVLKVIDGEGQTEFSNVLIDNGKIITRYTKIIIPNEKAEAYFECYDQYNYNKIWQNQIKSYSGPADVDFQVYNDCFFVPAFQTYVSCYSLTDGHLIWENDNSLYENGGDEGWNNESTGVIINNKWYAQPVDSNKSLIIYDINTGKKVGRIEGLLYSIATRETCWAVGNKLYVITVGGYFNCFEITEKTNYNWIILLLVIFVVLVDFI
jgi:hypothetical protein